MHDPVLVVQGLTVTFGSTRALHDVTFVMEPGERIGLLGRNGAGKSTLFDSIVGANSPSAGRLVAAHGVLRTRRAWQVWRARVGLLPQRFAFDPALTAWETVEYSAWLHRVDRASRKDAVRHALGRVDLPLMAQHTRMSRLSGGMVQRVGLASALVHRPAVLLLDEPTTSLDIEQRALFRDLLRGLDTDAAVLMSSHLAEDVAATCERTLVLEQGQLVTDAPTHELCGVPSTREVTGAGVEAAFQRAIAAAGVTEGV
ncbi:ABC transporter ATP-binding protein [Intrasporangium mesophilum]